MIERIYYSRSVFIFYEVSFWIFLMIGYFFLEIFYIKELVFGYFIKDVIDYCNRCFNVFGL